MKTIPSIYLFIFIMCISLNNNKISAKSMRLDMGHPTAFTHKKDVQVTDLKVTGAINQKTLNTLLYLYPNVENLDLLHSNIVAYIDEKQVFYQKNEIPASLFNKKVKLKSVILPNGVTKIGKGAFWSCTALEKVVLPSSIKVIDRFAFQLCVNLKSITFPEALESIGGATFASCKSLSSITCLSKTPPKMTEWNPFTELKPNALVVFVPKKSIEKYQNSKFLNYFEIKALK